MQVQGKATFDHEDGPFNVLATEVELIPDTPAEHKALEGMEVKHAEIVRDGDHFWLRVASMVKAPAQEGVPYVSGEPSEVIE